MLVVLQGEDALAPIKILIDELRNEDFQQRLKSVRRLCTIATALGPERTRDELVPYLNEMAAEHEDEDEVLLAMAEELGKLIEHVGGPEHAHVLLLPLETLCAPEEAVVRDKAAESLNAIAAVLPNLEPNMVALITRLAVGDYNSTRIASAPLFAIVYPRVSEASKTELRSMFAQLCNDDVPLVLSLTPSLTTLSFPHFPRYPFSASPCCSSLSPPSPPLLPPTFSRLSPSRPPPIPRTLYTRNHTHLLTLTLTLTTTLRASEK
jgi:hypothetical protein